MADAYLVPAHYPAGLIEMDKAYARNDEFGPLLGCKAVCVTKVFIGPGHQDLITRDPHPTYFFPRNHPRGGDDRYTWADRGDGVLAGTLVEDRDDA